MSKTKTLLFSVLTKLAEPKTFRLAMFVIPFALGFVIPGTDDVGNVGGGCTGG